jgi:hypothetical protein
MWGTGSVIFWRWTINRNYSLDTRHSWRVHKHNMSVNNTTFYLYTIKIVYCQGEMFRPLLGHLQALWENRYNDQDQHQCIVGSQMHWNIDSSWICFLRGTEDDLIEVETCRLDNILLLLTDVLYLYNTSGWKTSNSRWDLQLWRHWRRSLRTK